MEQIRFQKPTTAETQTLWARQQQDFCNFITDKLDNMGIFKIARFLIVFSFLISCDREEGYKVRFTGTVKYVSNNSAASSIPIKLVIVNDDIPFDRENPFDNKVLTEFGQSTTDGVYFFELNSKNIPRNASYILDVDTDSLLQIDKNAIITCMNTGSIYKKLQLNKETIDIFIDQPTFLQLIFSKPDKLSTDRIRYSDCLWVNETSMENPDTTFLQIRPYFYFKGAKSLTYEILKNNGEVLQYWIDNIELRKGDTTKVFIEY